MSRQSLDISVIPRNPDWRLSKFSISFVLRFSFYIMKVTTEGSRSPLLIPMIIPPTGVSPMLVSIHLPRLIAVIDEPLPRWYVIIFRFEDLFSIISAHITMWSAMSAVVYIFHNIYKVRRTYMLLVALFDVKMCQKQVHLERQVQRLQDRCLLKSVRKDYVEGQNQQPLKSSSRHALWQAQMKWLSKSDFCNKHNFQLYA